MYPTVVSRLTSTPYGMARGPRQPLSLVASRRVSPHGITCAIPPEQVAAAARDVFTAVGGVGGVIAGVEAARQLNRSLSLVRNLAPRSRPVKQEKQMHAAATLSLDMALVAALGALGIGVAQGLASQLYHVADMLPPR